MARVGKGQLNIPVPSHIGIRRTTDELFGLEYGEDALREQQKRYEEERLCVCPRPDTHDEDLLERWEFGKTRWGVKYGHKAPCPRAGKRF